jgi:rubredoxin
MLCSKYQGVIMSMVRNLFGESRQAAFNRRKREKERAERKSRLPDNRICPKCNLPKPEYLQWVVPDDLSQPVICRACNLAGKDRRKRGPSKIRVGADAGGYRPPGVMLLVGTGQLRPSVGKPVGEKRIVKSQKEELVPENRICPCCGLEKRSLSKWKVTQDLEVMCTTCWKKYPGNPINA